MPESRNPLVRQVLEQARGNPESVVQFVEELAEALEDLAGEHLSEVNAAQAFDWAQALRRGYERLLSHSARLAGRSPRSLATSRNRAMGVKKLSPSRRANVATTASNKRWEYERLATEIFESLNHTVAGRLSREPARIAELRQIKDIPEEVRPGVIKALTRKLAPSPRRRRNASESSVIDRD